MDSNGLKIQAFRDWAYSSDLVIHIEQRFGENRYVGKHVTMAKVSESERTIPALCISNQAAQELMDSLWVCGIRPTDGVPNKNEIDAIKYHLEDMRRLAFNDTKDN